eukprot:jgi/Ulvmu1/8795/UM048_0050.1
MKAAGTRTSAGSADSHRPARAVSPRRLADIEGHDIFKDTERDTNSKRYRPGDRTGQHAELIHRWVLLLGQGTLCYGTKL